MNWILLVFLLSPADNSYIAKIAVPTSSKEICQHMADNIEEYSADGQLQRAVCVTKNHYEGKE
jgi:hypothetical protein